MTITAILDKISERVIDAWDNNQTERQYIMGGGGGGGGGGGRELE